MRLSGGPGKPVPSHAALRAARSRVWGLLIALILLAVCQLVDWHQSQDVVTGAHGTFPAAFGAGAPVAPERVVRQKTDGEVLVHGLSIQLPGSRVTAVNLRTGKEYRRYERRDTGRVVWSIEASGRTVVAGFGDGRLVAIHLRTGKPLWQVEVQHDEGYRSAELAGGQAVTEAPGAVRAFAEHDGRSLWTAKTPKSGRVYVVRQPSLTDRDVGRRICADLLILDAGTGRPLHTLRLSAMTARDDGDGFMTLDIRDIADGAVSISWRVEEGGMLIATD